jgi:hypothetical protein
MGKGTATVVWEGPESLRPLLIEIGKLGFDPANVREHGDQNKAAIRSSLLKYGQRKPIVVNTRTMTVEAGNGTLDALIAMGWSHVAAVLVDDDEVTATGFAIADNRSAELASWNVEDLIKQIGAMEAEGTDKEDLGFTSDQLELLVKGVTQGLDESTKYKVPRVAVFNDPSGSVSEQMVVTVTFHRDLFAKIKATIEELAKLDGIKVDIS